MNKKGFTLIELLAVIVVLAIIALITVPTIIGVIERARKGAAESSALGYIDAIEKQIALDSVEGIIHQDKDDYVYDEIEVSIKGPTGGIYTLNSNKVTTGTFCINNYIVEYSENKAKASTKCTGEDLKLAGSVKLSKSSTNISYPNIDTFEVIENTSGGNLTCESSDSDIATCSIKDNIVTVKSGKKEGNATITITSGGNSKYKEAQAAFVVVTAKGLISFTANGYDNTYDGEEHGITVTSTNGIIKYGVEEGNYTLEQSPKYSDVGEYIVYYSITNEGYKEVTGSKTIKITKANGEIKLDKTSGSVGYNETLEINIEKNVSGSAIEAVSSNSDIASVQVEGNKVIVKGLGTGKVVITITSKATKNYKETSVTYDLTINKANNTLTLSANTGSITYPTSTTFTVSKNTSGGALSCASSNTAAATCSISGSTVTVTPGTTAASSVNITVTSAATTNYNTASATYVVTNNLGTLSVTANGWSGVWNDAAHGISVTSSGATIRYGTTSGTYNLTSSPTYKNVGTYTVYYQVTKAGYKPVTGSRQVKITTAYAQVGSNYYGSIQSAINSNNSGTITLVNNITESPTIPSGKSFTMDLNGKTITGTVINQGTLSIYNGTVNTTGDDAIITFGNLTVSSGTYKGKLHGVANAGTVNITNGTFTGGNQGLWNNGGTVTISGGTFTGSTYDGLSSDGGTITINGGSFTGTNYGIINTGGISVLNGGYARGNTFDGFRQNGGTVYLNAIKLSGHNWGGSYTAGTNTVIGSGWQIYSDQGWGNVYGIAWSEAN